jgi:hypothetical protein
MDMDMLVVLWPNGRFLNFAMVQFHCGRSFHFMTRDSTHLLSESRRRTHGGYSHTTGLRACAQNTNEGRAP